MPSAKADAGELVTFALAFPDTYELGMSHQGLRILYEILNARPDTAAERVFCPEDDMEALLRAEGVPLSTLESGIPLSRCRLVGFTLQSELHYSTIPHMLDLGGIPIRTADRGPGDPFVDRRRPAGAESRAAGRLLRRLPDRRRRGGRR